MITLTDYQERVLDSLRDFFRLAAQTKKLDAAFREVTRRFGEAVPYVPVAAALVLCLINGLTTIDFIHDGFYRGCPEKGPWGFVMDRHEFFDGLNQCGDAVKGAPTDLLVGEVGEPPFDQ
ncbi:hypothetical protein FBQ96_11465, partial [Nitrospirales bacterium NOB]|nr:hypothetical protein [Nitrospirales bacterium NOB]